MKLFNLQLFNHAPAFDFKRIPDVDDKTVEAFFSATHEGSRRMPLLIAQWVYAQLEDGEALVFLFGDGSLTFAASASDGADSFPFPDGALLLRPDGEGTA